MYLCTRALNGDDIIALFPFSLSTSLVDLEIADKVRTGWGTGAYFSQGFPRLL